jgi:hypothetical protein
VELDKLFASLFRLSEPLTASSVERVLKIHGAIVEMLQEVTRDKRSARSFVAKYMHCHNRIVPPFDANADKVLTTLAHKASLKNDEVVVPVGADPGYAIYVRRFLSLYDSLAQQNLPVTVRSLDYYLVWEHDNRLASTLKASVKLDAGAAIRPRTEALGASA